MKLVRFLLFPFSVLYDLITSIRNFFFNIGIFKETNFNTPIIVVGNLSVGGTGKTPQIEYLIKLLKDVYKVAVLSRGYKRKTTGFVFVNNEHTANDVGDEPLQYFKKFKDISVAVNENRVEGVINLEKQQSPEVVLLVDVLDAEIDMWNVGVVVAYMCGHPFTDVLGEGELRQRWRKHLGPAPSHVVFPLTPGRFSCLRLQTL